MSVDIPDEVRCAAYTEAKRTGRFPQWFLDLQDGKGSGPIPGCSHPHHNSHADGLARVRAGWGWPQ